MNGDILTGLMLQGGGSALWPGRCSCGHLCGFFGDLLMGPSLLGDTYLSRGGTGNSLVVQWLRLGSFTAMAGVWSWVWELRSYKLCGEKKEKTDALLTPQFLPLHPSVSTMSPLLASVYDQFSGKPGSTFLSWVHLNLQASLSSICSLICTYFPDAVSLGFPRQAPSVCPSAGNAWQSLSDAGVIEACQMLG